MEKDLLKIGAAYIESNWWGGLVMQYHKHIYPGIMKRYRVKGYYNENFIVLKCMFSFEIFKTIINTK